MDVGTILLDQSSAEGYQHNKKNYCCFNKILHKKKDGGEPEHNSLTSNKNTSENQRSMGAVSHISSLLVVKAPK